MNSTAKHFVEEVAAAADASAEAPMPPDVAAIESLANQHDVPISSLRRGWILSTLDTKREESVATALDRIAADVDRLRELVA